MQTSLPLFAKPIVKVFAIMLSCAVLVLGFSKKLQVPNISDKKPFMEYHIPKDLASTRREASIIKTGLFIKSFSDFDFVQQRFSCDCILWFIFNPTNVSQDVIDSFSFEQATVQKKAPPKIKALGNHLLVSYEISLHFSNSLNFEHFPFDDHRITLQLTNNQLLASETRLITDGTLFATTEDLQLRDWKLHALSTESGFITKTIDRYAPKTKLAHPIVSFYIEVIKGGIRKALIIFLPLFAIFFLGLLSLAINIRETQIYIEIAIASISTLLGYRFVIETITPTVGYFTISDKIYLALLFLVFLVLLINFLISKLFKNVDAAATHTIRKFRSTIFYLFLLIATVYTLFVIQ